MDIKQLQDEVNARWSQQLNNPCHHSADAGHAFIHLTKALGNVASALNNAEHEQRPLRPVDVEKYLADLVICAARFSDGLVDLNAACDRRLAEKFPIKTPSNSLSVYSLSVCPTCSSRGNSSCQDHWHERNGLAMPGQYGR